MKVTGWAISSCPEREEMIKTQKIIWDKIITVLTSPLLLIAWLIYKWYHNPKVK